MKKVYGYKKKISIDFSTSGLDALERVKDTMPSYGQTSNSIAVNYILQTFGNLNEYVRVQLAKQCLTLIHEIRERISREEDVDSFSVSEDFDSIEQLEEVFRFFTFGKGLPNEKKTTGNMVRTDILNGYVIYPDDWIVYDFEEPKQSTRAVVIEVRNGHRYNAPHVIFFTNQTRITEGLQDSICRNLAARYPVFAEIMRDKVEPVYGAHGKLLNEEEWLESPVPGFFFIADADKPLGHITGYPFGAKVYRTRKNQGEVE